DQLPLDLLMHLEPARVHALTDLAAMSAELGTPLDEEIEHVIIERDHGRGPLVLGFEHDPLGARGLEDLADRRAQVDGIPYGHSDPSRKSVGSRAEDQGVFPG